MITAKISRIPNRMGWLGGVGIALLSAACVMYITLSLPLRDEQISLIQEIQKLESLLRKPSDSASPAEVRQQLDDFMDTLPKHEEINDKLNLLHKLASDYHLALKNSEYRPSPGKSGNIRQLRIILKTEGEYPDIRSFLRGIQQTLPVLAIEQLSLSRSKISVTRLEAVIEFSLVYTQSDQKHS